MAETHMSLGALLDSTKAAAKCFEALPGFLHQLHQRVTDLEADNAALRNQLQSSNNSTFGLRGENVELKKGLDDLREVYAHNKRQILDLTQSTAANDTANKDHFANLGEDLRKLAHDITTRVQSSPQDEIDTLKDTLRNERKAVQTAVEQLNNKYDKMMSNVRQLQQEFEGFRNAEDGTESNSTLGPSGNISAIVHTSIEADRAGTQPLPSSLPLHMRQSLESTKIQHSSAPPTLTEDTHHTATSVSSQRSVPSSLRALDQPGSVPDQASQSSLTPQDHHVDSQPAPVVGPETGSAQDRRSPGVDANPGSKNTKAASLSTNIKPVQERKEDRTKKTTLPNSVKRCTRASRKQITRTTTNPDLLEIPPWVTEPAPATGPAPSKIEMEVFRTMWEQHGAPGKLSHYTRRCLDAGLFGYEYGSMASVDQSRLASQSVGTPKSNARALDTGDITTKNASGDVEPGWTEVLSRTSPERYSAPAKTSGSANVSSPPPLFVTPHKSNSTNKGKRKRKDETHNSSPPPKDSKQSIAESDEKASSSKMSDAQGQKGTKHVQWDSKSKGPRKSLSTPAISDPGTGDELIQKSGPTVESLGFKFRKSK